MAMCKMMAFACTALVAGSAASAADRAGATAGGTNWIAPGAMREALAVTAQMDESAFGLGGGCDCTWFNGAFDRQNGQISHLGGGVPFGAKAADDFYLCDGYVYDLSSVTATLLTTSIAQLTKARLEIYADCDGKPGQLLYTFEKSAVTETGTTAGSTPQGVPVRVVNVTFTPATEVLAANKNVVLKGGTYWVSVYGLTDGQCPTMNMCDATWWGTTGNGVVKGSVAHKINGVNTGMWNQYSFPGPWSSVEECCVGCTDLAFTVCAKACKILIDNGIGDRTSSPAGSLSQFAPFTNFDSRAADDFVVPPCDAKTICYIEGCVYTNCDPRLFRGAFEIYGNDCKIPAYALAGTAGSGSPIASGTATKIVDLGYSVTIDGRSLRAYRLEFHDLAITLPGGRHYWISVGVRHTFSLNERAYFCYNADCSRTCLIRFNPGQSLTPAAPGMVMQPEWTSVGRDFAFLVAIEQAPVGAGNSTPTCVADFDGSGGVNLDDLFGYLAAWFTGCP